MTTSRGRFGAVRGLGFDGSVEPIGQGSADGTHSTWNFLDVRVGPSAARKCTKAMTITLSFVLHLVLGCEEGQSSSSAIPVNGQTGLTGDEDVSALTEGDAFVPSGDTNGQPAPDGDDFGGAMPEDAPVSTEACDPEQWTKDQRQVFSQPAAPTEPPPVDEACVPVVDKSCATACDCKFIGYFCSLAAANKDEPWKGWSEQSIGVTGGCEDLSSCEGFVGPYAGGTLECHDGTCVTVGDGGHIRPLDLQMAE